MKKWLSTNKKIILISFLLSCFFLFPYFFKNFIPLGHDTLFHLSRIEGLAQSFKEGSFLPQIYPYKNNSFGYASPLFYSDFLLALPAILYLLGGNIYYSYLFTLFTITFLTSFTIMKITQQFTKEKGIPTLASILYLFCNYRITNVFVRGALGEVFAGLFIPIALYGIYCTLFTKKPRIHFLILGFSGLLLSHNLSFTISCFVFLFFIFLNWKKIGVDKKWIPIAKAAMISFLLTAFFSLPMLEQLQSQKFYLHFYASSSDLAAYALPLSSYFLNETVFGYGYSMALNLGIALPILSLFYFFSSHNQKEKNVFLIQCTFLGFLFMILPWNLIPWNALVFLRVIQFPWRLMSIACGLLFLPAALSIENIEWKKSSLNFLLIFLLILEATYHLIPVLSWNYGITPKTSYSEFIDGTYGDINSTFYQRSELAGADYLPQDSPDYREASSCVQIWNENLGSWDIATCETERFGTKFTFIATTPGIYLLPITYYKGYQVSLLNSSGKVQKKLSTQKSTSTLVEVTVDEKGVIQCDYPGTGVQLFSRLLSFATILLLSIYFYKQKKSSSKIR